MRQLAAAGLGLVVLAQLVFVVTGADRGPTYVAVNALSLVAIVCAVLGARRLPTRTGWSLLGGGLLGMGILRLLNVVLGTTRVAMWISITMFAGWVLAGSGALAWSADPSKPRDGLVRFGLFVTGAAYFASLSGAVSQGRISAIVGITLACIGLLVAAPNVRAEN